MREALVRKRIRVYGIVQGVGFRPTVVRHAKACGISGQVSNRGSYVEILAEGQNSAVTDFIRLVTDEAPERAVILKTDVQDLPANDLPVEELSRKEAGTPPETHDLTEFSQPFFTGFHIVESKKERGEIFISPDIAICDTCREELFDAKNRRYLHPFINCTLCGPRFSILEGLPYDRERISMKAFPMCPECEKEYYDRNSRRFDAQPVCCKVCGPEVYILGKEASLRGGAAITHARKILSGGGIVAVKGIGGFHLACDAANGEAVKRLRQLKKRPMKPFAVMAKDLGTAARECVFDSIQEKILTGPQKPILLLAKRAGGKIAESVAPDNPTVGIMLPYAPVQLLLFSYPDEVTDMSDVLVMTSGNASGAPIASTDAEALDEISGFCDAILTNNRDIRIRTDDSVMDFYKGSPYMIRRSRGYAPLPYIMSDSFHGRALGIGGELKNTFCLAVDQNFYPSAYVGDLADIRTVHALEDAIEKTESLLEMKPDIICADLHPRYNSGILAEKLADEHGIPLIRVQHHYAHVLSCMGENDFSDPVIGISFDGTGYGTDRTIWGGEFLLCDFDGFKRLSSIKPFLQIGGDASAREGWRIAVSMLFSLCGERAEDIALQLNLANEKTVKAQRMLFAHRMNAVASTSAGRLFDAVSALLGIRQESTFEGEAATALMYAALRGQDAISGKPLPDELCPAAFETFSFGADAIQDSNEKASKEKAPAIRQEKTCLPTDRLFAWLVEKRLAGRTDTDRLAYLFHKNLSAMIVNKAVSLRQETGVSVTALTGGVFQNRLLLSLVEGGLEREGFTVLRHRLLPPNDGGICLGQAIYAMNALQRGK